MSSRPAPSGKQAIKALERIGFTLARIEGSHHIMRKAGHPNPVVVPVHGSQALAIGTLKKIIKQAGLTQDRFYSLL